VETLETAIFAENITKTYKLFTNKKNKLFDILLRRDSIRAMHALKNISFSLDKGECLGLIGLNGSGKTTLSNIIAGVTQPTSGSIAVNGEASCVSVSAGLNQNLTGLENIEYKGLLLGFTIKDINELKPKIIEFADIGAYINQPVKYYSSGMAARLGFAISINIDPDVLVVDEGLSVGDQSFTDKCVNAMHSYRERGKTIVFVSHSIPMVESFCTKTLWLEYGTVRMYGGVAEVCGEYREFHNRYKHMNPVEREEYKRNAAEKHGSAV
jgi:teichoic acid transport system ATP-binding protein